jgi:hypothetical protein
LCENILGEDSSIRFAGIANHLGVMLASSYRPGLVPLMTKEETRQYALEAVTRALLRETFQSKIGRLRYAIGVYEKLIRATVAVSSGSHHSFYLLLSFDTGSDAAGIIETKILHIVKNAETEWEHVRSYAGLENSAELRNPKIIEAINAASLSTLPPPQVIDVPAAFGWYRLQYVRYSTSEAKAMSHPLRMKSYLEPVPQIHPFYFPAQFLQDKAFLE